MISVTYYLTLFPVFASVFRGEDEFTFPAKKQFKATF